MLTSSWNNFTTTVDSFLLDLHHVATRTFIRDCNFFFGEQIANKLYYYEIT